MNSIGDRLRAAQQAVVLIQAGLVAFDGSTLDGIGVTPEQLSKSLAAQADVVAWELEMLTDLPQSVLDAPAPDWDEACARDVDDPNEATKLLVEGALVKALVKPPAPKPRKKRDGAE